MVTKKTKMTKVNKSKLTCFLCRYEITKYNKSNKQVKYNGLPKIICKFCTKNKHKILDNNFKSIDIQCKICNKPSIYKKCIACSICNHMYHGKCLGIDKKDIEAIEKICNFYMCFECNKETLPMQFDNEQKKEKPGNKPNPKQCMTCCNIVPQSIYPNKYLIYNNKQYSLCVKCSKFETNIPVKDKTLIEFQDCRICCKQVKYESIFCNLCQHLIHPYCNGISKKELKILGNTDDNWYCMDCNFKIFPNQLFTTKTKNEIKLKKLNVVKEYITFNDCSVCCKTVSGNNTLSCNTCKHWVHKKCIGKFKNRTEYQNFLHYYSTKPWDCPTCTSEMLPFILLDNNDFNLLLLDIYTKPLYLNKENIESVYIKLKDKNFYNIGDTENFRQDHLDDIDPDLNFLSNDTCNYTIDTDHIVNKSSNELIMMTFNIRSIKKNFNNFVQLLCRLNCKIHIICLTETWLKELDNIKDFELDGYHTPQFQNRPDDISGGGVITYIHKDIEIHKHVKNLSFVDEHNH